MRTMQRIKDHMTRFVRQLGWRTAVGDHRFWVRGYISNIVDISSTDEPNVLRVIERLLSRPGVFLDVGANLGQTLGKVLEIDRGRAYLGFEPQIAACFYLNRFIRDNGLRSANVLPIGLSSESGFRKLYSVGDADCMASLERSDRHLDETIILTRRGDEVVQELGISQIAAIKIDVEGAELEVLRGLRETLSMLHPPVIFEVLPNFEGPDRLPIVKVVARKRNDEAEKLYAFWKELGFRIYQIDERGDEIAIDRFELDDPVSFIGTNFLSRPSGQSEGFQA